MKFSVLLSLYKREHPQYLRESLDSVFNQTLRPDEVILVEDGPLTADLYAVLDEFSAKYKEFRRLPLKENKGLGYALDYGLARCKNDLVARMDTDDVCAPNRFERQVTYMANHPEVDVCGSWLQEFEGSLSNPKAIKKVPATHLEISHYIKTRNPMNHPSVIFRRGAIIDAGGYQQFPLFEDYYLWARMLVKGRKFANLQECLVNFRVSPDMYKRRGGWQYAKDSALFQHALYNLGICSFASCMKSTLIRGTVYLLPNGMRRFVYKRFLRN